MLIDGFLYDATLAAAASHRSASAGPVAVVAIDRESLVSPRFESVPRVFLGPHFAELLDGLFRADAKAVGFDVVFAYAASRFKPLDPEYDTPFLDAIAKYHDRIVLSRSVRTRVADPIMAATFDAELDSGHEDPVAIAYSELVPDPDGVQRWVYPEYVAEDGTTLPTLAGRLAAIAGDKSQVAPFLLAPVEPVESIPTYAFAEVLNCIEKNPEAVKRAFAGRVVLVGSNLAEEDRKRAPDRFLRWPPAPAPVYSDPNPVGCQLAALGPTDPGGRTVPGVHMHAAAVSAMLTGNQITAVPLFLMVLGAVLAAGIGATLALFVSPALGVGALALGAVALFACAVAALDAGYWLPVAIPAISAVSAMTIGEFARFFVEEQRRRRVERAFGHYLAPTIVDQLAEADESLQLGGQVREVSIMFADLNNFTAVSDTMEPPELLELTNRYLKGIVEAIEETGGYVDKFVGDAVMALWGAPASTPDAAGRAVASAFRIQQRVTELRDADFDRGHGKGFGVKIGISSGGAIVGNVGAPKRFNYTALGATVNLAARIESACSAHGCPIMVDAATAAEVRDRYLLCEIDTVVLKGKAAPVSLFAPLAKRELATAQQQAYVQRYETALASYRQGRFAEAAAIWEELNAMEDSGDAVSPSRVMAKRARSGA